MWDINLYLIHGNWQLLKFSYVCLFCLAGQPTDPPSACWARWPGKCRCPFTFIGLCLCDSVFVCPLSFFGLFWEYDVWDRAHFLFLSSHQRGTLDQTGLKSNRSLCGNSAHFTHKHTLSTSKFGSLSSLLHHPVLWDRWSVLHSNHAEHLSQWFWDTIIEFSYFSF